MTLDATAAPAPLRRRLPDGSPLLLRPVRSSDKPLLQAGFALLSRDTLYARFHGARAGLTQAELRYLTEIDYRDHMAWLAIDLGRPTREVLGVGRYVRASESPSQADVAITVCDRYQRRGVGGLLLTALAHIAIRNNIDCFRAQLAAGNQGALALARRIGARISPAHAGAEALIATLDLGPGPQPGE